MAAGSAAERAEAGGREMAKKRGREVCAHIPNLCPTAWYSPHMMGTG